MSLKECVLSGRIIQMLSEDLQNTNTRIASVEELMLFLQNYPYGLSLDRVSMLSRANFTIAQNEHYALIIEPYDASRFSDWKFASKNYYKLDRGIILYLVNIDKRFCVKLKWYNTIKQCFSEVR